jgi:HlyD family secretion protein
MKSVGRRRMLIWGGIGVVVVVLLVVAFLPKPVPVDLEPVIRGPMQVTLDHEGKTRVRDRFVISAPVPGRVTRIELEPGDAVKANETVLATFEPTDPSLLDARTRAEARASVNAAEAKLERSRAERERARAESDYATTELDRIRRLAGQGIVSEDALDAADVEARARARALEAAESAVRAAKHELAAARARTLEPGDTRVGNPGRADRSVRLRSPVDGVVLRRLRESEAVVPAGEPLMEVADPADLEVVADFLSTDAVKMKDGMAARIEQWGGEGALRGRVRRVEPSGFMKISALGVEEQRVNVIVDFDDPREAWRRLGDEYRVEVRVVIWEEDDVVQVPTSSLFRHGESWAVFVVNGGKARATEVTAGRRTGLRAEILEGVEEGDRVVVHPSEQVRDGVRVEER